MVARRLSILDFRPVVYESGNFDLNTVTIVIVRNDNKYNTQYALRVIDFYSINTAISYNSN